MYRLLQLIRQRVGTFKPVQQLSGINQLKLSTSANNPGANLHKVNNLEKRFLVWTGKYKAVGDIPDMVAGEVVEKARNKMRIRVANGMMIVTLVACLVMSISGKRAHERGESVQKENLAWHKSHQDEKK